MDWKKTNLILDAILKVGKIICLPAGVYVTYLGAFARKASEGNKAWPFPIPSYDPDAVLVGIGLALTALGAFAMTRMTKK